MVLIILYDAESLLQKDRETRCFQPIKKNVDQVRLPG